MIGVVAHLGGKIEGDRQTRLSGIKQMAKARVGVFSCAEARVLAHRPELAAIHRGVDAARERRLAGRALVGYRARVLQPIVAHRAASTDCAYATSRLEPMISGVRWWSSVGLMSKMSRSPSIAAPPACSTTNASG